MLALATATDNAGLPITLETAAKLFGVDHFNWIQEIISDPDLIACKGQSYPTGSATCDRLTDITGTVPALGTLDPPLGGWKYAGTTFPTQDFNPFYWDEYFRSKFGPPDVPQYKQYQVTERELVFSPNTFTPTSADMAGGYLFYDEPSQTYPGTAQFVDFLVGVRGDCDQLGPSTTCSYFTIPNTTFTWTLTNGIITPSKYAPLDLSKELDISPLAPLGCSDPICGEAISLDDALSLTGSTLVSFEALGNFDPKFAGTPGKSNCHGQSVAALTRQHHGLNAAAAALGYASVNALQNAIMAYCGG
jgi:hypothetical protein